MTLTFTRSAPILRTLPSEVRGARMLDAGNLGCLVCWSVGSELMITGRYQILNLPSNGLWEAGNGEVGGGWGRVYRVCWPANTDQDGVPQATQLGPLAPQLYLS